jgi:hypothetical protein
MCRVLELRGWKLLNNSILFLSAVAAFYSSVHRFLLFFLPFSIRSFSAATINIRTRHETIRPMGLCTTRHFAAGRRVLMPS